MRKRIIIEERRLGEIESKYNREERRLGEIEAGNHGLQQFI